MKMKVFAIVFAFPVLVMGCIPFASDELNTKIWMSEEKRVEGFKQDLDYDIGKELYSTKSKAEICSIQECNPISETLTEYVYQQTSSTNPSRKCVYAWTVDSSQSQGDYQYGTGLLYLGLGKKIKWRYLSSPDQCLMTIGFSGPW